MITRFARDKISTHKIHKTYSMMVNLNVFFLDNRSVGGCRASLYNPVTFQQVERLCQFMKVFQSQNQS